MTPSKALRLQIGELLAADTTTLAQAANENTVSLIISDFTEDEDLEPGDVDFATFTGSAPIDVELGDQAAGIDPITGDQVISLVPPVGGFRYECTAAPASPEVVFGYMLRNAAGTVNFGTKKLTEPVTIENVSDFVDLGIPEFRVSASPIS